MSKLSLKAPDEGFDPGLQMETCSVMVRLSGDVRNEVPVKKVTPAELILLRLIHGGAETVVVKGLDGTSPLSATGERMRLLNKYPRQSKAITEMFPGLAPQFPRTIAEAEALAQQELNASENEHQRDPLEA